MTTYKAMIITDENKHEVAKLIGFTHAIQVPQRWITNSDILIWTMKESPTAWTLPYVVFSNRYTVVGHEDDYWIVERI